MVRYGYYPGDRAFRKQAEALQESSLDVGVICLRGVDERAEDVIDGVSVRRIRVRSAAGFVWLVAIRLFAEHLRHRIRLVQVTNPPNALVFSALPLRMLGASMILDMPCPAPEQFATTHPKWYHIPLVRLSRFVEMLSLKMADRVLVENREFREHLGARGGDINEITVVMPALSEDRILVDYQRDAVDEIAQVRKDGRHKGDFTIVSHLDIDDQSGVDLVIEAIALLKERIPGLTYRVFGNGDAIDDVIEMAEGLKIRDRILIRSDANRDDIVKEILFADAAIIPVRATEYSMLLHPETIVDYITLGKPIVITRLRALESYFPDDSLYYFRPNDSQDLADTIYSVFAHPQDVNQHVARTRDVYDPNRWERESKKFVGVYRQLLGGDP